MLQYTQELIDFFTIMDIAFPLIILNQYFWFVLQLNKSYQLLTASECVCQFTTPNGSCTAQGGGGITNVAHATNGAIGIALFGGLANAQKGAAADVYYLQEWNVALGIYPIKCAIGIEAIEPSILANGTTLVGGCIIHIQSIS